MFQVNKILSEYLQLQTEVRCIADPQEMETTLKQDLESAIYSQSSEKVFILCNFWRLFPNHRGGSFVHMLLI